LQTGLFVELHHEREAGLGIAGRDDDGLLMTIDPPGDGLLGGKIFWDDEIGTLDGFEESGADSIFFSVVQKDGDKIEGDDAAEFPGEDAKEFLWIAVDTDGLRDTKEGFETSRRRLLEGRMRFGGHAFVYLGVGQLRCPLRNGNSTYWMRDEGD
jgi:hypothetical protein